MWHVVIEYFLMVHLCPWPPGNPPHAYIPHGIKRNASDASVFIQRSLYRSSCSTVLPSFVRDLGEWGEQSGRMSVPVSEILRPELYKAYLMRDGRGSEWIYPVVC